MPTFRERFIKNLFQITPASFEEHALALFQYQATHNPIYKKYMAYLHLDIHHIKHSSQIPFYLLIFSNTTLSKPVIGKKHTSSKAVALQESL